MYKKIIVPIDLAHAEKAPSMISAARKLSEPDARIWLVHAVEALPQYASAHVPGGAIEESRVSARKELEKLADQMNADVEVVVRDGKATNTILDLADEKRADAIVIASHQPDLRDYFLGSTAAGVVRHAQCSVLVLR